MQYILFLETAKKVSSTSSGWHTPQSVLSILAIIISLASLFWQSFKNEKHHRTNLEAEYYREIYWDYLLKKIPEARQKIKFSQDKVTGTKDMTEVLNLIRQDSLFFKYKNKKYYDKLIKKIQGLEDMYINPTVTDSDGFARFHLDTEKIISDIYEMITAEYLGHKSLLKRLLKYIKIKK